MALYRAVIRRLLYGRENHCHSGKIQEAARAEFLDKGFQGTSLRQIVKNAGVTTGAFYGYFSSKEALFNALVEPHAAALMGKFMEAQISFAELPEEQQLEHMGVESGTYPDWMGQHRKDVIWMDMPLGHLRCTQKRAALAYSESSPFHFDFQNIAISGSWGSVGICSGSWVGKAFSSPLLYDAVSHAK